MSRCPNCAEESPDDSRFCNHCGSAIVALPAMQFGTSCQACGGNGAWLTESKVYCGTCRWLRPLGSGYEVPVDTFLWRLDADAMRVLRSLGPLTTAAHAISERVGRPWFEASVNGLRLSERQLPDVFAIAIKAARIVGLSQLPELYVSGEQMWDANTLGSDHSAFIVIGSVLLNFKEDELLFILAREMGHCRAGHALWKTVMQFVSGRSHKRSIAGDGLLKMLNPAKLIESAIDAPLMAWARHAEITADNAGLLAVGSEAVARRVLQAWTFRSFPLLQRINQDAWMEQEDASDAAMMQVAEWTLASAPYLPGRLRLMREFARSDFLTQWRALIEHWAPPLVPAAQPQVTPAAPAARTTALPADQVRLTCTKCSAAMVVPKSALSGGSPVNVRCPNTACGAVLTITPRAPAPSAPLPSTPVASASVSSTSIASAPTLPAPQSSPQAADAETIALKCAACSQSMRVPVTVMAGKDSAHVRCPNTGCRAVMTVRRTANV